MPCQVRLSSAGAAGAVADVVCACAALPTASRAQAQARRLPGCEGSRRPRARIRFIATATIELKFLTLNSIGLNTVVALRPQVNSCQLLRTEASCHFCCIATRDAFGAPRERPAM